MEPRKIKWTGRAGDCRFDNPDNWEGGIVPRTAGEIEVTPLPDELNYLKMDLPKIRDIVRKTLSELAGGPVESSVALQADVIRVRYVHGDRFISTFLDAHVLDSIDTDAGIEDYVSIILGESFDATP